MLAGLLANLGRKRLPKPSQTSSYTPPPKVLHIDAALSLCPCVQADVSAVLPIDLTLEACGPQASVTAYSGQNDLTSLIAVL